MVKLLDMPHLPTFTDIIEGVNDILNDIGTLPATGVEAIDSAVDALRGVKEFV